LDVVPDVELIQLRGFPSTLAGRQFDYVIAMDLLDRSTFSELLKVVHELLTPGGEILFYESNLWNPMHKLRGLPIVLTGVAGASWLAYDNYRVTGHHCFCPTGYYEQYETVPPFWVIPISTAPRRHFDLKFRTLETYERDRSWHLLVDRPLNWLTLLRFYYGNLLWLLPVAAFAPSLWRSNRTRFATILALVIGAASWIEVWWYPHYAAPFVAILLILVAQSMRYLRQ
jgi:hypothetical protein